MTQATRQAFSLLALRVSLGLLFFWWGMNRLLSPSAGVGVQKKFYAGLFPGLDLQAAFGAFQMLLGLTVILGLARRIAMPVQFVITGFSAVMIWSALLDPFGLWLPMAKIAPVQHLFYPSVIALCGALVMVSFRGQDRFALDVVLRQRSAVAGAHPGA